ncbi:u3 small nucleolar RNA-associated protein 11 [Desarmillaria tabescens]|uniref:U3 small nucleolar RNA-associated protein 11 n=1 Tax=Armillaria tabescens TaxID=1929756 RepID=A0AA39NIU8_ARMTA|nr:u3 small nucleolar RNA-associated protein 11 [Desarmillaria tabescens]KAK0466434.1 u3 small nucleolar RNA-associated protein 11 [Desarmillaria tabescens]
MTSSLRNSIHRRNHKERSQLAHRAKLGILEKHADYVKRARDYHSKQDKLNRLRQKAADRNKDEFYFSMTKEKTKGGVHVKERGNVALPIDMVKVLKTQDENYIRTIRAVGLKKIDKIKVQLSDMVDSVTDEDYEELGDGQIKLLEEAGVIPKTKKGRRKSKHTIFVENEDEVRKYKPESSPVVIHEETTQEEEEPIDLGWKQPSEKKRSKKSKKFSENDVEMENKEDERGHNHEATSRNRQRLFRDLAARLARDKQLRYAEREFEMQRLMMGKGARKKLKGVERVDGSRDDSDEDQDELDARKGKPIAHIVSKTYTPRVYKWRRERKK